MDELIVRKHLANLFGEGQAHATVRDAIAGLSPANRTATPAPGLHSVWQEFEHLRIAQHDILQYTVDPNWQSPKWPDGYWPENPENLSEETWTASVSGFFEDVESLVKMANDPAIDLTSPIRHGSGGHTYLRELLLAADHNAYHAGQIVLIRKALSDWPGSA